MNAIGMQVRDPINSGTDPVAVDGMDRRRRGKRKEGDEPSTRRQIQSECGKWES